MKKTATHPQFVEKQDFAEGILDYDAFVLTNDFKKLVGMSPRQYERTLYRN